MHPVLTPPLAALGPIQPGRPLFGHLGLALAVVLACIALLLVFVALLGRWLAATHPAPAAPSIPAPAPESPVVLRSDPVLGPGVASELAPVIIAAATRFLGAGGRVVSIRVAPPAPVTVPSLEALMQQWSHEGRRQIYSSHKVR